MDSIALTSAEGGQLLSDCLMLAIPHKIEGLGTWDQQTVAVIGRNVRQLFKAIKAASPIFRKHQRGPFGPEAWYSEQKRTVDPSQKERELDQTGEEVKNRWVLKDEHRLSTETVPLSGAAKKGLSILLLLRVHPGPCYPIGSEKPFHQMLTPGLQEERIWPIAEKLGISRDLEAKIGVANKGTDPSFKSDEEYEKDDAEEKKLTLVKDEKKGGGEKETA